MPQSGTPWHTLSVAEVAGKLKVTPDKSGLSRAEAESRLQQYGPNQLEEQHRRGVIRMLIAQFSDFMIMVLIAAAIVSGFVGEPKDSITIIVIVLLNAAIGFVQEYRAERAVAALKKMAAPMAQVMRDSTVTEIPAAELVPGDRVLLEAGNIVPADLRMMETVNLSVEEAALTGESQPVHKHILAEQGEDLPLGDRKNMAYKGTIVARGRAMGMVVATGMATELGRIAALLTAEPEGLTPLQKRLAQFGQRLAFAVIAICAVIFVAGILRGEPWELMFLTAISLAVAAIPEALPAVVTISLALGAYKMVKHHALIRRLPAVETLGSVTYICTDKTGTLTQNRMVVTEMNVAGLCVLDLEVIPKESKPWMLLLEGMALNNDVKLGSHGKPMGDPTEVALYLASSRAGWVRKTLEKSMPRLREIPFDSVRKRMTTFHQRGDEVLSFTKGAPETILPCCARSLRQDGEHELSGDVMLSLAEEMAARGLRVMALAYREWEFIPETTDPDSVECKLVLLGLIGMMDPLRKEAAHAVSLCKSAGITPVMITGDHPETARAIAREAGILDDAGEVMTGAELGKISQDDFERKVRDVRVYARVDPLQKIRIVKGLQDQGEFVAMTGDGVNDAPALRAADIGVAMGKDGTDVAREASHMVLLDDNFSTIVTAVREGRHIYDNIRKFIKYAMTGNSGEIWAIFLAPILGLPIPLLPIQILWVNLVTDGLPGLALAVEPAEKNIMDRPPRSPGESVFAHGMWQHIMWVGFLIGALTILAQAWGYQDGMHHWQTMAFTVLALAQMFHVLAIRSERESLFTIGFLSNWPLLATVLLTLALQMAIIYIPALQIIFDTQALSAEELGICLVLSFLVFPAVEMEKWLRRRGLIYQ